jgi:hypothetical protein
MGLIYQIKVVTKGDQTWHLSLCWIWAHPAVDQFGLEGGSSKNKET